MTTLLIGAQTCARCGFGVGSDTRFCERCGVVAEPAAGTASTVGRDLLAGCAAASAQRRRGAIALTFVIPVVFVGLATAFAVISSRQEGNHLITMLAPIAVAVIALAIEARSLSTRGTTSGRALLGIRTVDTLTASPVALGTTISRLFSGRFARTTASVDLRLGRDPLTNALSAGVTRLARHATTAPIGPPPGVEQGLDELGLTTALPTIDERPRSAESELPDDTVVRGAATIAPAPQLPRDGRPANSGRIVTLRFDTGQRLQLERSLLIGRNPDGMSGGVEHPAFAWPDLSRTLSKTHALLEWDGRELWITDLRSTNGTSLVTPDGVEIALAPTHRKSVPPGWTVAPGDRALTFGIDERVGA